MANVFIRNQLKSYKIEGNDFIPVDVTGVKLHTENIVDDKFFEFSTNKGHKAYGFFHDKNDTWIVTETPEKNYKFTTSTMAGCWTHRKRAGIYEEPIALIDTLGKAMNYRIPRNGSTAIVNTFANTIPGHHISSVVPWPSCQGKLVVKKDNINNTEHENRKKFFVWRDPVDRLLSYIWMILEMRWIRGSKYHIKMVEKFYPNFKDALSMFLKVIEINNIFGLEDEYHLNTQAYTMNALGDVPVDYMVKIEDIKQFTTEVLDLEFIYKTTTKPNNIYKSSELTDEEISEINRVLKCDFDLFDKYKDKLYTP